MHAYLVHALLWLLAAFSALIKTRSHITIHEAKQDARHDVLWHNKSVQVTQVFLHCRSGARGCLGVYGQICGVVYALDPVQVHELMSKRKLSDDPLLDQPKKTKMDNGVADGGNVEIDENLHSRQLAVYGREVMRRMAGASVLVSGANGVGVEIGMRTDRVGMTCDRAWHRRANVAGGLHGTRSTGFVACTGSST